VEHYFISAMRRGNRCSGRVGGMMFTISGSEIGAVLGLNPYQTPMDLYMKKLALIDAQPENEAMRWGSAAEHVVARRYAKETSFPLYPSIDEGFDYRNPLIHPDYSWWTGTPDRQIIFPDNATPGGLLEIKIVGERMAFQWGDPPDGAVPESYLVQCAWYMPILGVEWADLAVQIGNKDYRVYRINRDREFENQLRDAALAFIENHLIPEIPPPIDGSESSGRYLNIRYPQNREPLLETEDPNISLMVDELREVRKTHKSIEEHESELTNRLKEIIGDQVGIKCPTGKVTWTQNKPYESFDTKGLIAAHPDIAAKFKVMRPGARVFRAYFPKEG
jgi:putative phage-type endonuclease